LSEAERIALANGDHESTARARVEIGYVRLPEGTLRPRERRLAQVTQGRSRRPPGEGDDLPGFGGQRQRRLPASDLAPAAGHRAVPHRPRAAPRGLRPVDARAGRPVARRPGRCGPPPESGHRPGGARPLALVHPLAAGDARPGPAVAGAISPLRPTPCSNRSPAPARWATPAGRASRPAGWACWRKPRSRRRAFTVLLDGRAAPRVWRTPTGGSTCTSSTHCASWAAVTATPTRVSGWRRCTDGRPGRDAGAHRSGPPAQRRAREPGGCRSRGDARARHRQPQVATSWRWPTRSATAVGDPRAGGRSVVATTRHDGAWSQRRTTSCRELPRSGPRTPVRPWPRTAGLEGWWTMSAT
jgi:hypothetical protein